MSEPTDKRVSPRVPFTLRVSYSDDRKLADATENLSNGGLFVQTEAPFAVGEQVALSLSFPGLLAPMALRGVVTWKREAGPDRESGVGIRVEDPGERARLEELVSRGRELSTPRQGPYRVLLVEDNPHVVEMYSYALKKLALTLPGTELEVRFAKDGHGALQALRSETIDLVLTDLYMPVMDGFQLVEKLRAEPALKDVPVVAISAGGADAKLRALDAGVDVFLRKPVRFVEVLQTVKQLLHLGE